MNAIILPEYLTWFLNNPAAQNILKRNAIGSSIASISKVVLENLEITVPPISKQQEILELSRLSRKENEILLKIAELKQQQIQQQIINAIK